MDIECATCGEPWDVYYLRHEAIYNTGLPEDVCKNWNGKLTDRIREEFKIAGYEFGSSIYAILYCPCCRTDLRVDDPEAGDRRAKYKVLSSLFEDDEDGLIAELSE